MVVVRIELWPGGDKTRAKVLGEAEIANVGGGPDLGDYSVRLLKWGAGRRTWKSGKVTGFPRIRLGPWDLLFRALASIVRGRNADDDADPSTLPAVGLAPEEERCPKCGGEVQGGYGLMGGGIGAYRFCTEEACDMFEKTQDKEEMVTP